MFDVQHSLNRSLESAQINRADPARFFLGNEFW
jgi:hypothetical protein